MPASRTCCFADTFEARVTTFRRYTPLLQFWLANCSGKYSNLTGWVEDNIDETLTFYRLPRQPVKGQRLVDVVFDPAGELGRAKHCTPVTDQARMPRSA